MEIMFLLTVILTTLTQHCTVVHAGGTFSSYFILGVPRYSSATAEFYLVTMSDVPFYVTCRIKEPRTIYTEEKIYLTEFYLTRYKVFVKSLDLENNPNYRSIVFENPKYENDFAVTMMIIDKRTGNWIDSMLALPATSFYTEFYVPWFGIRALQAIVMSSAHGNLVELYYFNRDTNVYYSEDFIFVNYEEFADFSRIMCDTDYYLKPNIGGGKLIAREEIGVIIAPCQTSFNLQCETDKINFPFIESTTNTKYLTSTEFVAFSRFKMSNNVIEEYDDLLMIVAVNTRRTTVVINEETMLFFDKPHRMTVMISSDIPKHIKADNLIVCYYLSKGNDCASSLALAWLVPVELFYFSYAFSVPYPNNSRSTPMRAYLIMVAEKDLYSDILVDDMRALSYNALVSDVPTSTYQIRYLQVSPGWHSAYSTNMNNFGLYLYGWKDSGTFLHAVGFVVKQEVCTIYKEMQPGDLIDNDCDGSVDEDIPGPDTDPMKRNDFKRGKAEDGGWGEWRGFTCVPCYDTFYTLRRSCDNPAPQYEGKKCAGYDTESSQEKCDNCLMTPCPIGTYGPSCENVCRHCAGACHKITGECPVCSNGWTGVRCTTPCPEMTYGHACRHSCLVKCNGRDCIERELGLCPSGNVTGLSAVVYYLLLVLILGSLYGFFMSRSHLEEDPDVVVTVKRVSSKEYTVTEQIVADQ